MKWGVCVCVKRDWAMLWDLRGGEPVGGMRDNPTCPPELGLRARREGGRGMGCERRSLRGPRARLAIGGGTTWDVRSQQRVAPPGVRFVPLEHVPQEETLISLNGDFTSGVFYFCINNIN